MQQLRDGQAQQAPGGQGGVLGAARHALVLPRRVHCARARSVGCPARCRWGRRELLFNLWCARQQQCGCTQGHSPTGRQAEPDKSSGRRRTHDAVIAVCRAACACMRTRQGAPGACPDSWGSAASEGGRRLACALHPVLRQASCQQRRVAACFGQHASGRHRRSATAFTRNNVICRLHDMVGRNEKYHRW